MTATEDKKEAFYDSLNAVIKSVPYVNVYVKININCSSWATLMPESVVTTRRGPESLAIIPSAMRTLTDPCCYKLVNRMS